MANPRKPTPLRRLEGNPGHRPIPEDAPFEAIRDLSPPSWLKARAAIETWRDVVPVLARAGLLTQDNRLILAHLCDAQARYLRNRTGAHMRDVKQLLEQLGMTPATRSKVAPVALRRPDNAWSVFDTVSGSPA